MLSTSIKHLININILLYSIFNENKLYYHYKNRINVFKFSQIYIYYVLNWQFVVID